MSGVRLLHAVHGEKVWLRDVQYGFDSIASIALCRKIQGPVGTLNCASDRSATLGTR